MNFYKIFIFAFVAIMALMQLVSSCNPDFSKCKVNGELGNCCSNICNHPKGQDEGICQPVCFPEGFLCAGNHTCCSNNCREIEGQVVGICKPELESCLPNESPCQNKGDCCSDHCYKKPYDTSSGTCQKFFCTRDGDPCQGDSCCSKNCVKQSGKQYSVCR